MRKDEPWVVFGASGMANKAVVGIKDRLIGGDTKKVLICQLKDAVEIGSKDFTLQDISKIYFTMYFCRKESLKAFISVMQDILDDWKEDA